MMTSARHSPKLRRTMSAQHCGGALNTCAVPGVGVRISRPGQRRRLRHGSARCLLDGDRRADLAVPPGSRSSALGFLLFFASAVLLVPAAGASLGKIAAAAAFVLAAALFALTGIYDYQGGTAWEHASGWVGLVPCLVALYNTLAFEIEDTRHRTVLPVLCWGTGRTALDGSEPGQVKNVEHEAGVREQL
jgi:hypothetical protein